MILTDERIREIAQIIYAKKSHVCLLGPAGLGKSRIAFEVGKLNKKTMSEIDLQRQVSQIRQACRMEQLSILERSFRAPHHTVSEQAMVGKTPDPVTAFPHYGEFSIAHGGILLLDELPEFRRSIIERLNEILKDKRVDHWAGNNKVSYPADFWLITTMNPCPCGLGVGYPGKPCTCSSDQVRRYKNRVKLITNQVEVIDLRTL